MVRGMKVLGMVGCALLLAPAVLAQQSQSTIAGLVRDAAGVPVAGVRVEASSDVLIEKVRTVVTDGGGQYKIVGLGSGKYDVTFSAPGFSTVRNVGVDLPSAFTATVNAQLKPGAPGEVITVTSANSQVDTQSVAAERVISAEQISSLPTGQASAVQTS